MLSGSWFGTIAAYGWGMTYRIETSQDEGAEVLVFQGVLDRAALEAIEAGCALARRRGARAVVLSLGTGSTVDGECIAGLRAIEGLAVRAASPFLAHWLRQSGICCGPRGSRSTVPDMVGSSKSKEKSS